jgi:OmpA-OmpF porin, OOP family
VAHHFKVNDIMRKTAIAAALALSLGAGLAQAQASDSTSGFYGGIDIGHSRLNASGLDDDTGTALGLDAGYRLNRYFAVEAGYAHLGDFSPSYQARALSLSAIGILPLERGFSVYGKLGLARTHADVVGASDHNDSPLVGAGVLYDVNQRWFVKAGLDHYAKVGGGETGEGSANVYLAGVGLRF